MIYWFGMLYVQKRSQQSPDNRETLSSQQQSTAGPDSAAIPTTQHQPSCSAAGQQTKLGKLP